MAFFPSINTILLHIVLPHVQIALLKLTSCDNQALVGCIPNSAVVVDLPLNKETKITINVYVLFFIYLSYCSFFPNYLISEWINFVLTLPF